MDYALAGSVQVLDRPPFPTPEGIQTVFNEPDQEAKGKTWKLKIDGFVDLRAVRELEKQGFFK